MSKSAKSLKTSGDHKRRELFNLYSKNLEYVKRHPKITLDPDEEGVVCPICFKLFTHKALSKDFDDHLTLEDVPPSFLGGKVRALTCKVCNNRGGTELESHLGKRLNLEEFNQRVEGSSLDATFHMAPDIEINAVVSNQDEVLRIEFDEERSDPGQIQKFIGLPSEKLENFRLDFRSEYKINRPEVALLRIAYLWAFSFFGHGFLVSYAIQNIRHQILHPKEKILPSWGIFTKGFEDEFLGVNVITQPQDLRSYLIVFDLKTSKMVKRFGVVLPGPNKPGITMYEKLAKIEKSGGKFDANVINVPKHDYLVDPENVFASHMIWEEIKQR